MPTIFSNRPGHDYVINPFSRLSAASTRLQLAAPYFTSPQPILEAAAQGKRVQLLIGLNEATRPAALRQVHEVPGIDIRYFTRRFHAKLYVFDQAVLLGSANLTQAGLTDNREAVICLDRPEDRQAIDEARALFAELWEAGHVLTREKLNLFEQACRTLGRRPQDAEKTFEDALGVAQPTNVAVESKETSREHKFLEGLRRQIYEEYRPAFHEVMTVLEEYGHHRPELVSAGRANDAARFLSFVRLTHVAGDAWKQAPQRVRDERRPLIAGLGEDWATTDRPRIPEDYLSWLQTVRDIFGTAGSIEAADRTRIITGLMCLHAFAEQSRYVEGGRPNLPGEFWAANQDDLDRVKRTLTFLLHGSGDFVERLYDVINDPDRKLGRFGLYCALELYGTVKTEEFPPMNGRTAKVLRFLGFDVKA